MQSHHKIGRTKKFSSCTKNGVFFSAASCKKKTARKNFSPSYIMTAVVMTKANADKMRTSCEAGIINVTQ